MPNPLADIHGSLMTMDLRDFRALDLFLRRYPTLVKPVVAQLLNDLAFRGRPVIVSTLDSRLIMRNPRFALGRTRVEKAGSGTPLNRMAAYLGTVYTYGKGGKVSHDGWASLQRGSKPTRERTIALAARGGQRTAQARRQYRLIPGQPRPSPDDQDAPTPDRRLQMLLRILAEQGGTHVIRIPRGHGLTPGLYRTQRTRYALRSGRRALKLQRVQRFDRTPQPKRWPWIRDVITTLRRTVPMGQMWAAACDKVLARFRAQHPTG